MIERNERAIRALRNRKLDRIIGEGQRRRWLLTRDGQQDCPYADEGHDWIELTAIGDNCRRWLCGRCSAKAEEELI